MEPCIFACHPRRLRLVSDARRYISISHSAIHTNRRELGQSHGVMNKLMMLDTGQWDVLRFYLLIVAFAVYTGKCIWGEEYVSPRDSLLVNYGKLCFVE